MNKYTFRIGKETCQMSPVAFQWIGNFLGELKDKKEAGLKIIEFGSGVSTIALAELRPDDQIVSIEENKGWYGKVRGWLEERGIKNVELLFEEVEVRNYYRFDETTNPNYFHVCEKYKPFDLIINDGNMREYIGDSILEEADDFLTEGGLYLRHDYEKSWDGVWVGPHLVVPEWVGEGGGLYYDSFCATHPGYELITVNGNGRWGYKAEFGGAWRKGEA